MKKLVFFFVAAFSLLLASHNADAQCSLAKFTTANGTVSGADLATYDIHAGDVNNDKFQDLIFQGSNGPFLYLNKTGTKGKTITFTTTPDWSYTHKTTESFKSNNTADFNNDTLADIVEFYGNYIYFFRNTTSGSKVSFHLDTSIYVTSMSSVASAGGDYGSTIVADINNDGLMDVIADTRQGTAYVYLNTTSTTGGHLSFSSATTIKYSTKKPPTTSYMYMEIANCGDLNDDGLPEFVVLVYDSLMVYKNTSSGSTLSFARDSKTLMLRKPSLTTGSGNFVFNMEIADIDRDGYPDVMTHYTVTNKGIDSNFVFFMHQNASKSSISWNKKSLMYLKWKPGSGGGGTVDMGNAYLYSPACQKPNLIALFDAAESGSTNTFYFFENLSKPGTILFNPKACIINNAHSDAMAYADFNNDGIRDYVTYQDANAITTFTDTSHVHPIAKATNKADVTTRDTCIGSHKYTYVSVGLLYLECATDTVGYTWSKGVSHSYWALLDSGTFSLRYTNSNGTVDSTINFSVNNKRKKPIITPIDTLICQGEYLGVKVRGSKSYTWKTTSSEIFIGHPHDSGQFFTAPTSTSHFTVYCVGAGGCLDTLISTINIGPSPHVVATPLDTTICIGTSVPVKLRGASTYTITPAAYLTTIDDSDYISKPSVTETYHIVGNESNCIDTANVVINVHKHFHTLINTHHSPDTLFCVNEIPFFTLRNNTHTAMAYVSNGFKVSDSLYYLKPALAGTYTFYGTRDSVCFDTVSINITLENPPVITGLRDTALCAGQSVVLKASGATNYVWQPNDFLSNDTSSTVTCTPLSDKTYTVIGSDVRCKDTAYVKVHYVVLPNVEAGPDSMIDYNTTFTFLYASTDGKYFQWKPVSTLTDTLTLEATTTNIKKQTNYILTSWNESECPVNDTITILIRTKPLVFFPSGFTPNGDGRNDYFRPLLHTVSRIDWRIYNRWGQVMYEGQIKDKWDGTVNGVPAPQGTYIYEANATASYSGETLNFKGDFELIR